jgi:hypothetical protein
MHLINPVAKRMPRFCEIKRNLIDSEEHLDPGAPGPQSGHMNPGRRQIPATQQSQTWKFE